VPSIDGTHMNVALARTVENGDGERSVEPSGQARRESEHV
jgi:hypothetical protein